MQRSHAAGAFCGTDVRIAVLKEHHQRLYITLLGGNNRRRGASVAPSLYIRSAALQRLLQLICVVRAHGQMHYGTSPLSSAAAALRRPSSPAAISLLLHYLRDAPVVVTFALRSSSSFKSSVFWRAAATRRRGVSPTIRVDCVWVRTVSHQHFRRLRATSVDRNISGSVAAFICCMRFC